MHRQLTGGGTEADLRRMAGGLAARGHDVHVFCARAARGAAGRRRCAACRIVRGGRLVRLVSFARRGAARGRRASPGTSSSGFGRTPRQDVVRVGGGTHRSYLARMEAAGLRRAARGPYHRAILWLEGRQFAPDGHRRVLAVSRLAARRGRRATTACRRSASRWSTTASTASASIPARRPELGPALREELGIAADVPLCAAVGTGFARKGFDLLLALLATLAAGRAPRSCWSATTSGWRAGGGRRPSRRSRGACVVTGPRRDVEAVLAAADVLCVPSRQEAFGNVVLEACAAGVPVVTSRRGRRGRAARRRRSPRSWSTIPRTLDALAAALERALGPDRGRARRRRARGWPRRCPWDAHLDERRGAARGGRRVAR